MTKQYDASFVYLGETKDVLAAAVTVMLFAPVEMDAEKLVNDCAELIASRIAEHLNKVSKDN